MNRNKLWLTICVCVTLILVCFISSIVLTIHKNDVLVSRQVTCFGKVLQQSWGRDIAEISALQACNGIQNDYSIN